MLEIIIDPLPKLDAKYCLKVATEEAGNYQSDIQPIFNLIYQIKMELMSKDETFIKGLTK